MLGWNLIWLGLGDGLVKEMAVRGCMHNSKLANV